MGDTQPASTKVIGIGMQKGGVGKTTNAVHLAVALARQGRRCLLWDLDENCGATKLLKVDVAGKATTAEVLAGDARPLDAVMRGETVPGQGEGADFLPAGRTLAMLDSKLGQEDRFFNANDCLKSPLAVLKANGRYDYVILDTGPSASTSTRGAYMAADYFILSVMAETMGLAGLGDALEDLANVRRPGRNPGLELLGVVVCAMDRRRNLAKGWEEQIGAKLRGKRGEALKFTATIGRFAAVDTAAHLGKTVFDTEPDHPVTEQFRAWAREVEARVAGYERLRSAEKNREVREVAYA